MNIYVSNLGYNVTDSDLKKLFTDHGNVSSAKVIMDKFTNQSRGFGFVEMSDNDGEKAIKAVDGAMLDGRPVKASEARPRENKTSFSSKRY